MAIVKAVCSTFGTYMACDFLSNFIQHPTQKMDYGIINKAIGREVDQPWWGTRTEHIVGVAACLAITDHMSQGIFGSILGRPLCFAKSPAAFVFHTVGFIFAGVTMYVAADAALNPTIKDKERGQALTDGTYSSYVGSCTAWFEGFVAPAVARVAGDAFTAWQVGISPARPSLHAPLLLDLFQQVPRLAHRGRAVRCCRPPLRIRRSARDTTPCTTPAPLRC
jgi:hypothetical protein